MRTAITSSLDEAELGSQAVGSWHPRRGHLREDARVAAPESLAAARKSDSDPPGRPV